MSNLSNEPQDDENIDCHLQQVGMGTLICRAARQTGDNTTNEVSPSIPKDSNISSWKRSSY